MVSVLKHDYLRRSMEQRVQRKALYNEYRTAQKNGFKDQKGKETLASRLRSQSVLEKLRTE